MGRVTASKTTFAPDPRYHSLLASKFINCLMYSGKKSVAQNVFYDALEIIRKKIPDHEPIDVFHQAVENVKPDMQIMCAEAFGPLVNFVPFDNFEDALAMADEGTFGLQAGVYTRDLNKAMRAVQRLNVGGVIINDVPTLRIDNMPYGGNRDSGVGREGPRFAVEEMTTLKAVIINMV